MILSTRYLGRGALAIPLFLSVASASPLVAGSALSLNNHARSIAPTGEAFLQDADFNDGVYGPYITQSFVSSNVTATRINMMQSFTACDDGSYIFITPRGEDVKQPAAAIYDPSGSLVWTSSGDLGQIYNFQVQLYKDEQYLTFWGGNDSVGGHGSGHYYMYDKHYNLVRKISAGNGLEADLHSFTILPDGVALATAYEKVQSDMADLLSRPQGSKDWVWDSLFQEFDLDTGEVIFQWRASDHFHLHESYTPVERPTKEEPWDWFHINMVEKDGAGNYLVSARHLRCIAYISGTTGDVLWKLGGKSNMFEDLSGGEATFFIGQHDAHWDEGQRFITLFDNRADWQYELEHVSKGRRIEIDVERMTAKINTTYIHPLNIFAFSQGSYQTLPNRNVLIGYGYTGAFTEFSPEGEVLCDAYLQPSSRFSSGDVQSYRNMKFNWTGVPLTKPSFVLENSTLSVSWLGSTEVHGWTLQHSHTVDGDYAPAFSFPKAGFETEYVIPDELLVRQYLRVVAMDQNDKELEVSLVLDIDDEATLLPGDDDDEQAQILEYQRQDSELFMTFGFLLTICILILLSMIDRHRLVRRCWSRRKNTDATGEYARGSDLSYSLRAIPSGRELRYQDSVSHDLLARQDQEAENDSNGPHGPHSPS